jgi:large subunit ribosomal protein L14
MVFTQTILKCADNSGALLVKCIRILGKSPRCRGYPGDFIIVSIKTHRSHRKVKRGEVYKAVLARVGYRIPRQGNITVQCTSCAVVLLNKRELPLGSRVLSPVMRELRMNQHYKILGLAPAVI